MIFSQHNNIQELHRIPSFLYEMTKDQLSLNNDTNFSFYHFISQKLSTLNSITLEEELALRISPGPDITQPPPTIGKCANTEDSINIKLDYIINEIPPTVDILKEGTQFNEEVVEDEQPFNEIIIGESIFADEMLEWRTEREEKKSVVSHKESVYRLESVKCSKDEVIICVTTDSIPTSPVSAISPPSLPTHKEVDTSSEKKRKIPKLIKDYTDIRAELSNIKQHNTSTNTLIRTPNKSRKNSIENSCTNINKLRTILEEEIKRLDDEKKYTGFSGNFFMRVSIKVRLVKLCK